MARNTFSKSELAARCGVSSYMIRKWCNVDYLKELTQMGYTKNQKEFTPRQAAFLMQNIVEYSD